MDNGERYICDWCRQPSTRFSCENPGCDANPDIAPADIVARNRRYAEEQLAITERQKLIKLYGESLSRKEK